MRILSKTSAQSLLLGVAILTTSAIGSSALAQVDMAQKPVLVITNDAMPASAPPFSNFVFAFWISEFRYTPPAPNLNAT